MQKSLQNKQKTNKTLTISSLFDFIFARICNISFVFAAFCDPLKLCFLEALEGIEIMLRSNFKNIVKPNGY